MIWAMKCEVDCCKRTASDSILKVCSRHSDHCPICLVKLGIGDDTARLNCGHTFHACCIYKWFDNKVNCPMCRS